ncbi:Glycerophosphoryl diester phosphodiesterase [Entamoeba marina]
MGFCVKSFFITITVLFVLYLTNYLLPPQNILDKNPDALDRYSIDMVETDLQLTSDNEFIIVHDDLLDRTTNGHGNASDYTLAELQQLDAGYGFTEDNINYPFRMVGIKLPSLQNLYDAFKNTSLLFSVEMKNEDPSTADILVNKLKLMPEAKKFMCFSSSHYPVIQRFRELTNYEYCTVASEHEVAELVLSATCGLSNLYYFFKPNKARIIQAPFISVGGVNMNDKAIQKAAKSIGADLVLFTINDGFGIANCLSNGCHGVMTDRPDIAATIMKLMELRPSSINETETFNRETPTTSWDCTTPIALFVDFVTSVIPFHIIFAMVIYLIVFVVMCVVYIPLIIANAFIKLCSPLPEFEDGSNGVARINGAYHRIAMIQTQKIFYDKTTQTLDYSYTGDAFQLTKPSQCEQILTVDTPAMCSFVPPTQSSSLIIKVLRLIVLGIVGFEVAGIGFHFIKQKQISSDLIPFYSIWCKIFGGISDLILIIINNGRATSPRF